MTLRTQVYDRCVGHAGMAALIGTRCYPERLPKNVDYPAVSFIAPVSYADAAYRTHDNVNSPVERAVARIQLNCYGATGDAAEVLADQAVDAWSGYKDGCTIGYAFIANRIATREDALDAFRSIVDVMVEYAV